jgi:hypothetical protein
VAVWDFSWGVRAVDGELHRDSACQVSAERPLDTESPSNRQGLVSMATGGKERSRLGDGWLVEDDAGFVDWVNSRNASSSLRFQRRMQRLPWQADAFPHVWGGHTDKGACDGSWGELFSKNRATRCDAMCGHQPGVVGNLRVRSPTRIPTDFAMVPFRDGEVVSLMAGRCARGVRRKWQRWAVAGARCGGSQAQGGGVEGEAEEGGVSERLHHPGGQAACVVGDPEDLHLADSAVRPPRGSGRWPFV